MTSPNGAVIWEGPSAFNGEPIFAAITGMRGTSLNEKTGPMAQVWILHQTIAPLDYRRTGADEAICGNCPQRHSKDGGCYVNPRNGPQAVWHTYQRGGYEELQLKWIWRLSVRFGAYGDPAAVPLGAWSPVLKRIEAHTSYTHQWRDLNVNSWGWCMASVDSPGETYQARKQGWRTFRAKAPGSPKLPGEITCPASTGRTTCIRCRSCAGRIITGPRGIAIDNHGNYKSRHTGSQPKLPFGVKS